jgi:hypothetical protein
VERAVAAVSGDAGRGRFPGAEQNSSSPRHHEQCPPRSREPADCRIAGRKAVTRFIARSMGVRVAR